MFQVTSVTGNHVAQQQCSTDRTDAEFVQVTTGQGVVTMKALDVMAQLDVPNKYLVVVGEGVQMLQPKAKQQHSFYSVVPNIGELFRVTIMSEEKQLASVLLLSVNCMRLQDGSVVITGGPRINNGSLISLIGDLAHKNSGSSQTHLSEASL